MSKKASLILLFMVMLLPIFSASITVDEAGAEKPASNTEFSVDDKITLQLGLTSSCDFGITTDSFAGTAQHVDEIILDKKEENNLIQSEINAQNKAVYVYYRATGNDSFKLYLSLEGNMVGTVIENNSNQIGWYIEWTDDNGNSRRLKSNENSDDGGVYNSENRYILTYNRPSGKLGNSDIRRIDTISINDSISSGSIWPDIYQGTIRLTLVTSN